MDFRNWILDTFTPVVMVMPSAEAESMVADRNGFTIVDLFRPYGYFHHLSGTVTYWISCNLALLSPHGLSRQFLVQN